MVKFRVNGFGHIGLLVTRVVFKSGKVNTVIISDPSSDLNYMVYMFQFILAVASYDIVKAKNRKLVTSIFRNEVLPTSNGVMQN